MSTRDCSMSRRHRKEWQRQASLNRTLFGSRPAGKCRSVKLRFAILVQYSSHHAVGAVVMKARKGQRGGSSGGKRTRAHVEVGIREVLSQLMRARADPATRRIVALECRHDVVDVSWDLFIADDDGRRWYEVKDGEVKGDDIVDFARKVAGCFAVDRAEEFILRTRLMGAPARALERLAGLAREPGDQLVTSGPLTPHERAVIEALGDDSQGKLRRVRIETYSSKENADATRNDALL